MIYSNEIYTEVLLKTDEKGRPKKEISYKTMTFSMQGFSKHPPK